MAGGAKAAGTLKDRRFGCSMTRAELCRVAQVAFRSASLLRGSASRWPSCSFSVASSSSISSIRQLSTTAIFRSRDGSWTSLSRTPQPTKEDDAEITKPNMSAYDGILVPEIDFDTGELNKSIAAEERAPPPRPTLRLVPRTGRTIHVGRNVDIARSFKLLNMQMALNRVPQDFSYQRFHERAGLKRKRLKSERWRKRFKMGFKACVGRVKELSKQGW
ncbi:hypothetical protein F4677DRAFT_465636 [Hypoxylon crocopeplum]|nr:hypothetical protein F4677DRAFT_465636 [Hypoxylon crocopeplum]